MINTPQSYHNGHKRLLKLLVEHLSADIYAWQPASIARVTVIPANSILQPANLRELEIDADYYFQAWKTTLYGNTTNMEKNNVE